MLVQAKLPNSLWAACDVQCLLEEVQLCCQHTAAIIASIIHIMSHFAALSDELSEMQRVSSELVRDSASLRAGTEGGAAADGERSTALVSRSNGATLDSPTQRAADLEPSTADRLPAHGNAPAVRGATGFE